MPTVKVFKSKSSKKKITKIVKEKEFNFLKYWRIVRYWAKRKYDITTEELEVLLYLYDEELFTRSQFRKFEGILAWDKTRFNEFVRRGWIVVWRDKKHPREAQLHTLSIKAKRICHSVYKKLSQEEHIPENAVNNPIFKGDNYADKVYRQAIKRMNQARERKLKEQEED